MNFSVQAGQFKTALTHASLVTTKQSSLDILEGVYISVSPEGGIVRATNLQLGVEIKFPTQTTDSGSFVCDAGLLLGVVGGTQADHTIECEVDGTTLQVTTPMSESTIKLFPNTDFPTLPTTDSGSTLEVKTDALVQAWQSVMYAASQSDIKPEISSVFTYTDEDKENLYCVSTDSFRLAEKKVPIMAAGVLEGAMIPVRNIQTMARIFNEAEDVATIAFSDSQMSFRTATMYCVTRLTDGRYPAYQQILPREFETEVTLLKNDLVAALRTLNIFADKFYQIDIVVNTENSTITFSSHHPERGSHTAKIEGVIEGNELESRCNAKYLQDCLGSITSDSLTIKFVAGNKPFIVTPIGSNDFQYLVMPLNRG